MGKYSWEASRQHGLWSTVMSLSEKQEHATRRLPPNGIMLAYRDGSQLSSAPKQDASLWDSMIKFYSGLGDEAVKTAKVEAKSATLLVMAELERHLESSDQQMERQVSFIYLRVGVRCESVTVAVSLSLSPSPSLPLPLPPPCLCVSEYTPFPSFLFKLNQ